MSNPQSVNIEGLGEVSQDELFQLDFGKIEIQRDYDWPAGKFRWRVVGAECKPTEMTVDGEPQLVMTVTTELECVAVHDLQTNNEEVFKGLEPDDLIGRKFFGLRQPLRSAKDLGRLKGLLVDTGMELPEEGAYLPDLLEMWTGTTFDAPLLRRPNRNDRSQVFTNMVTRGNSVQAA